MVRKLCSAGEKKCLSLRFTLNLRGRFHFEMPNQNLRLLSPCSRTNQLSRSESSLRISTYVFRLRSRKTSLSDWQRSASELTPHLLLTSPCNRKPSTTGSNGRQSLLAQMDLVSAQDIIRHAHVSALSEVVKHQPQICTPEDLRPGSRQPSVARPLVQYRHVKIMQTATYLKFLPAWKF